MERKRVRVGARLLACAARGNLTISDLAVWIGKPRSTLANWISTRSEPSTLIFDEVYRRLELLEDVIGERGSDLIPFETRQRDRKVVLKDRFNAANRKFSSRNTA